MRHLHHAALIASALFAMPLGCSDGGDTQTPPLSTLAETPSNTETESPVETASETPIATASETPTATLSETPTATASETQTASPSETQTATLPPTPTANDLDGDGFAIEDGDCNDDDPLSYPGAEEVAYDGIDQDCDGSDLTDVDGDGYDAEEVDGDDCDDNNINTYPGAEEFADEEDNDCDGDIDEALSSTDDDLDGFSEDDGDCNDNDDSIYPDAEEVPYDGIDQDCDGMDLTDVDEDGFPGGPEGSDCDDENEGINPDIEEVPYDGIDQDCSGADLTDVDEDGFDATGVGGEDCNDDSAAINPDAPEVCDSSPDFEGIDNNCDGIIDDDAIDQTTYYDDADGDGYGDADTNSSACYPGTNQVRDATDCDDSSDQNYPGADEICDVTDNDCDLAIDEGVQTLFFVDSDSDGYGNANDDTLACDLPDGYVSDNQDCDDDNGQINPDVTEVCDENNVDENCNNLADDFDENTDPETMFPYYPDSDIDGFGSDSSEESLFCDDPSTEDATFLLNNTDCDDSETGINPDAQEICDDADVDEDCDGLSDNDDDSVSDSGFTTYYTDADQDGFGDENDEGMGYCDDPSTVDAFFQINQADCNDAETSINPDGTEVANLIDDDCDGEIDEGLFFASCQAIHDASSSLPSAVYTLDPDGVGDEVAPFEAYCDMESDGGGWTLVLKVDGSNSTFTYDAELWTNTDTLNPESPDFDQTEAKLASYHTLSITEMRVGMLDGDYRWINIPLVASSLYEAIEGGNFVGLGASKTDWMSLVASPNLQPYCNAAGFNAPGNLSHSRVRIGITSNNENDCSSCDSFLGIGGIGQGCGTSDAGLSAGNWMTCEAAVNKPLWSYVYVR